MRFWNEFCMYTFNICCCLTPGVQIIVRTEERPRTNSVSMELSCSVDTVIQTQGSYNAWRIT